MADVTRMKVSQSATIYHRMELSGDAPIHDTATSAELAGGLGSSADFQLAGDSDITIKDQSQVVSNGIDELDEGSASVSCSAFIWIKHSGFTTSAKTTATTEILRIHFQEDANHYISIAPHESILFHNPGTSLDQVGDYWGSTSSGDIYAEVKCGET